MFKIIEKLAPAPPTGLYSPVAPLTICCYNRLVTTFYSTVWTFVYDITDKTDDHIYETLPEKDTDEYTFGPVTVKVKQGDILAENADCIVNSTNEDLDLTRGK